MVSIQGIYRDGKVELIEEAPARGDGPVIVTFVAAAPAVPAQSSSREALVERAIESPSGV